MTSPRRTRLRTLAPIAGATLALVAAGAFAAAPALAASLPANCQVSGSDVTCRFTTPGDSQLTLPDDVTQVSVIAVGGAGGRSKLVPGGLGQRVADTLGTTPGSRLTISVGGAAGTIGCLPDIECSGGVGGGGYGGAGGGGGGASSVYASGGHVIAGGGGGGGATGANGTGGAGGAAGVAGNAGTGPLAGGGGTPGTATAAGKGGTPAGTDGGNLIGGSSFGNTNGGGGGGSGVWGGGSGSPSWDPQSRTIASGGGGGGGGGSSYAPSGASAVSAATVRDGSVEVRFTTHQDVTAPVITITAPSTVEAQGPDGAVVTYTVTATDDVDGTVFPSCDTASGTELPLGPTTITCYVSDSAGNFAQKSVTVTVQDTTPPGFTGAIPGRREATSPAGAVVRYTVGATDAVDGRVPVSCSVASGSVFPVGSTPVDCQATDAAGNTGRFHFDIVVVDTTAPVLTLPGPLQAEATGPDGAAVTYPATASDIVSGSVPTACTPASGATFPLGETVVHCSATDTHNNTATGSFTVTVSDGTAPSVSVPDNMTVEATGPGGAVASFTATASDAVSGSLTPTCSPVSGSAFAIGVTTVTCSATDGAANTGTATFTVTVVDTTKPVVTVPAPVTSEATGPGGAAVSFPATASDTVSGSLPTTCSPASGSTFPVGTTKVTCSATDAAGNTGSASFDVTVRDTTGPTLTLPAPVTVPATSANGAVVTYAASASDLVDGSRPVSCSPASGTVFPVGTTTVTCTASDTRGNQATGTFTVTVQPYRADLQVTVAGPTSVTRGGVATYTVTVRNTGPSVATNVRTVLAAAGLSVTGTTPSTSSGSVKIQGVTYTGALWTTASIPAGGSVTFTLKGTVTAKKGDSVVASGAATSDVPDAVLTNNVAAVRSTVSR